MATQPQPASRISKVDAKVYLANERTFLTWMRAAVLVGSTGAAITGLVSLTQTDVRQGSGDEPPGPPPPPAPLDRRVLLRALLMQGAAMALLLLGAVVAAIAGRNYLIRGNMIRAGVGSDSPQWDSRLLPRLLTAAMAAIVAGVWATSLLRVVQRG